MRPSKVSTASPLNWKNSTRVRPSLVVDESSAHPVMIADRTTIVATGPSLMPVATRSCSPAAGCRKSGSQGLAWSGLWHEDVERAEPGGDVSANLVHQLLTSERLVRDDEIPWHRRLLRRSGPWPAGRLLCVPVLRSTDP